jgi:hypothetical protein
VERPGRRLSAHRYSARIPRRSATVRRSVSTEATPLRERRLSVRRGSRVGVSRPTHRGRRQGAHPNRTIARSTQVRNRRRSWTHELGQRDLCLTMGAGDSPLYPMRSARPWRSGHGLTTRAVGSARGNASGRRRWQWGRTGQCVGGQSHHLPGRWSRRRSCAPRRQQDELMGSVAQALSAPGGPTSWRVWQGLQHDICRCRVEACNANMAGRLERLVRGNRSHWPSMQPGSSLRASRWTEGLIGVSQGR